MANADVLLAKMEQLLEQQQKIQNDHERRIRSLERQIAWAVGGFAVLQMAATWLMGR